MPDDPDFGLPAHLLDLTFGGRSVRENLRAALEKGTVLMTPDGHPTLPAEGSTQNENWLFHTLFHGRRPSCRFLFNFLFEAVYGRACVPLGCQGCYKVKVCPPDFKALLAFRNLSQRISCNSKCGLESTYRYSQELYGGYFYCHSLEEARAIYRQVRAEVDATPELGPSVPMRIKRGCSPYEVYCGPSDQWRFRDELAELEAHLLARFVKPPREKTNQEFATLMYWVEMAHAIGDDSYLEFTKGRRVFPATVSYEP